ncbi:MAG: hypothetical protein AAF596_11210, partial [Planctomycetota bacterium]
VADELTGDKQTVVWRPRGGRAPFLSAADVGLWIGGQLNGPTLAELAEFAREMRTFSARTVALLDFPRADETRAAARVGVDSVLAKPWDATALRRALTATDHPAIATIGRRRLAA